MKQRGLLNNAQYEWARNSTHALGERHLKHGWPEQHYDLGQTSSDPYPTFAEDQPNKPGPYFGHPDGLSGTEGIDDLCDFIGRLDLPDKVTKCPNIDNQERDIILLGIGSTRFSEVREWHSRQPWCRFVSESVPAVNFPYVHGSGIAPAPVSPTATTVNACDKYMFSFNDWVDWSLTERHASQLHDQACADANGNADEPDTSGTGRACTNGSGSGSGHKAKENSIGGERLTQGRQFGTKNPDFRKFLADPDDPTNNQWFACPYLKRSPGGSNTDRCLTGWLRIHRVM
jgi:hypothetical protein